MNRETLVRFQRDVAAMILVFLAVTFVDLGVISLVTGKIRFWWPIWIDPDWNTNPASPVVYSQSYFAGILLVPYFVYLLLRDLLGHLSVLRRVGIAAGGAVVLAGLLYWKGSMTLQFGKERELAAWALLTVLLFAVVRLSQSASRLGEGRPANLFRPALILATVAFSLLTLSDPIIQLGVRHLAWSRGLTIELIAYGSGAIASMITLARWAPAARGRENDGV